MNARFLGCSTSSLITKFVFLLLLISLKPNFFFIPEIYLKDIIIKADPFVRHYFRNWSQLTKKFMVELIGKNIHEKKNIKNTKEQ